MASALHRTTKEYRESVSTPEFPVEDWIINPDLLAVAGWPNRYWLISGDAVTLMGQAARDAVDAAILSASRDAVAAALDGVEDIMRAFALTVLDELNLHAARIKSILDAIDAGATLAQVKTGIAAIADPPQRTVEQLKTALRNKLGG